MFHVPRSSCSCVHCYAVFLLCSMYVFGVKKTPGIDEIVFFSPHTLLISPQFLQLLFQSEVLLVRGRHVSSTPLAGVLPADRELRCV